MSRMIPGRRLAKGHGIHCLMSPPPSLSPPVQSQLAQFSLAYMVADVLFYLVPFTPGDFMFLVHHCISGFYVLG